MSGFAKIYGEILTSTVWGEDLATRAVWITMLVMSDANGYCPGAAPGLARIANVTVEQCRHALDVLLSPDPDSRTRDHDGRRLLAVDGGWIIVNHQKYRHRDTPEAERKRRQRERARLSGQSHDVTAEAEAEAEAEAQILTHPSPAPARPRRGRAREDYPDGLDRTLLDMINRARKEIGRSALRTVEPTASMRDDLRKLWASERPSVEDLEHVVAVRAAMDARGEGFGGLEWTHLCIAKNFARYRDRDVHPSTPPRPAERPQYRGAPLDDASDVLARRQRREDGAR